MAWRCCCSNQGPRSRHRSSKLTPCRIIFRFEESEALARSGVTARMRLPSTLLFPGYYAEFSQHPYTTPKRIHGIGLYVHEFLAAGRCIGEDSRFVLPSMTSKQRRSTATARLALCLSGPRTVLRQSGGIHRSSGPGRGTATDTPMESSNPAFAFNCYEHLMRKAAAKKQLRMTSLSHCATQPTSSGNVPACHCCGSCGNGCDVGAFFSTPAVTLPDAIATGKLTLRTDAVVRHVVVDKEGRPQGVGFFDRTTKKYEEVFAKAVVLAASTLESTRIMLNSKSRWHPNGLANSSGVLGHYLTDHFTAGSISGVLPELVGTDIQNDDGTANASYIPRFRNVGKRKCRFSARLLDYGARWQSDFSA